MSDRDSKRRRVLIVTEGPQNAVGLVRAFEFEKHFAQSPRYEAVFACRTFPFAASELRDWHYRLTRRVMTGPLYRAVVQRQERRIAKLARHSDLIYLVGVASLDLHRQLVRQGGVPILFDLIDALWLPYHQQFGWQGLDEMLATSHGIACDNQYTADYAKQHNDNVSIIPSSPQLETFDKWRSRVRRDTDLVVLGWLGSPAMMSSLFAIWEPLEELFRRHPQLHLRIVGGSKQRLPAFENVRYSLVESYTHEEMVREVLGMHIGLFPLFHVEDSLTRGAAKARLYMSGGAVAVCENYGASRELIEDGINGVLADTPEEWIEKLDALIQKPDRRNEIAQGGLETIRKDYSKSACFERLLQIFDRLQSMAN